MQSNLLIKLIYKLIKFYDRIKIINKIIDKNTQAWNIFRIDFSRRILIDAINIKCWKRRESNS